MIFGRYLGIFGYGMDLGPAFLIVNGALSYGLMIATVLLLRSESFLRFYLWTVVLGIVYELVNHFYPVWFWTFNSNFLYQEIVLVFAAYCGLALLIAVMLSLTTHRYFPALEHKPR